MTNINVVGVMEDAISILDQDDENYSVVQDLHEAIDVVERLYSLKEVLEYVRLSSIVSELESAAQQLRDIDTELYRI